MKLFGWGKSKDIQPQTILQQVNKPDSRNSRHGLNWGTSMGPKMPCKGSSTGIRNKRQGLFRVEDDGSQHCTSPKHKVNTPEAPPCDKKLQEAIQFVFSHEQEGLLAIGTFALEQLAAIRSASDEHLKAGTAGGHGQDRCESCTGMRQTSDDKNTLPGSWIANARRNTRERPVYGLNDVYTSCVQSEAEQGSKEPNQSKALTLYNSEGNRSLIARAKPIILLLALPPELRKVFDSANLLYGKSELPNFVPHWTNSVPPPVLVKTEGPCADEESYYSSRYCGLFGSKKKRSSNSKRLSKRGTVHIEDEDSRKLSTKIIDLDSKKSISNFGNNGMPSLRKLAKMWRSSCEQSSARIAPERRSCSPPPSQEFKGPPCAANAIESGVELTAPAPQPQIQSPPRRLPTDACSSKAAEFRRSMAILEQNNLQANANPGEVIRDGVGSNRESDGSGHWIRTDSEFVVLEM